MSHHRFSVLISLSLSRCPNEFTGRQCEVCHSLRFSCHDRKGLHWFSWMIIFIVGFVLSMGGYTLLRYNLKWIRVKYLFTHRRLHEHIGLEISAAYSHLPTSDVHSHDRSLEDVLSDEDHLVTSDRHHASRNLSRC